ncbi:hypothetical protein GCM10007103_33030 [Salinimicrobium marinum]|uniref:Uncharacterized protein n=1 Tax=Salinimicrobium marinum TaxID=680283 RepID=A0A918SLB4_9FLAO|nr:hypothetical protein GCM10007103_33030 [Salinimicrobium marinum]
MRFPDKYNLMLHLAEVGTNVKLLNSKLFIMKTFFLIFLLDLSSPLALYSQTNVQLKKLKIQSLLLIIGK